MGKYQRFNLSFLAAALVPILLIGSLNFTVDPYEVFNQLKISGFNQSKPKKKNSERLSKAIDIIRIKPVTILLGSSRAKLGLDPTHPALNSYQPAYNLGLDGVNGYEEFRYLQHAIANQKNIKLVIIGIDFFMFNSYLKNSESFSENRLGQQHITMQDTINTVFSWDAFDASRETLIASINDPSKNVKDSYVNNGFEPYRYINKAATNWRFKSGIYYYYKFHNKYSLSKDYLVYFKKIVDTCNQKNITLKVFISPSHATQWEAIRATGHWHTFEQWKREIVKTVPVLDFSGYNSITIERINDDMKNYTDNSHYRKEIGNLVLNRVLSYQQEMVPQDFGILITSNNIESNLAKIRNDREVWAKNNPREVKLVQEVKLEFESEKNEVIK